MGRLQGSVKNSGSEPPVRTCKFRQEGIKRCTGSFSENELIVVDIFPRRPEDGYWGDMTRTFLKGKANDEQRRMVNAVRKAEQLAIGMIKPGVTGGAVHRAVERYFEGLGYKVVACTDSQNALASFLEAPDSFDLVLTDQTMPGLTGIDLALAVRKQRDDIPIVICSGYSPEMTMTKMRKIGISEYVMKPIDRSILAQAVRRALDGGVVPGRASSVTAE